MACQHCSNYIFILNLTPGFNGLAEGNCKTRWQSLKFSDLVLLTLEISQYFLGVTMLDDEHSMLAIILSSGRS